MQVNNKIRIDLLKRTLPPEVDAVQGDAYSRYVEISLFSGFAAWTIPPDAVAAVRYRKPDGTRGYYDTMPDGTVAWHIQENAITIQLAPQMLTVKGDVLAQIEIIQGVSVLTTFSLKIHVEENAAAGFVRSEDYTNWLQWMEQRVADRIQEGMDSGLFQGPPGPSGPGAELISSVVTYQANDSGTIIPSGHWSESIPAVAQGKYLWTRVVQTFNTGDPVTSYTVSRMGIDGTGSVTSVCSVSPNENGNIPLTAKNIGALPTTGGTMEGPINMNGQSLTGLSAPTVDTDAASKAYADTRVANNLLVNSDFLHFIAQAGIGGAHGNQAYAGDRWILDSGTVTGTANTNGDGYANITLNGTIRQVVANPPTGDCVYGVEMVSGTASASYANGEVTITSAGGVIKNVGLYSGKILPKYVPKGYAAELMECYRYFLYFPYSAGSLYGYTNGTTDLRADIDLPIEMRATPTISIASLSSMSIMPGGQVPTSYSVQGIAGRKLTIVFKTSGLTGGTVSVLKINTRMSVSADL